MYTYGMPRSEFERKLASLPVGRTYGQMSDRLFKVKVGKGRSTIMHFSAMEPRMQRNIVFGTLLVDQLPKGVRQHFPSPLGRGTGS